MKPVRVLVVDDSVTVRKRIVEVLAQDASFEVVGEAGDGPTALALFESRRPDVVSLDIVLPGMSGLEVTRRIMSTHASPILIVSASANRGEVFDTLDALRAGAVEVFDKSRLGRDPDWIEELKTTLRLVARIRVVTRPAGRRASPPPPPDVPEPPWSVSSTPRRLVVLGASTGGPAALARLLSDLPKDFRLPILIVVHLAPLFADHLVEWLGRQTPATVRIAQDGEPLPAPGPGAPILVAPPSQHLVVAGGRLALTSDPERHSCRPSVDVLFESVAIEVGSRAIAGLLTGMGRDGAEGLLALRRAGALTFAQDSATAAVFGMPREAIQLGAAAHVLGLGEMASALGEMARGSAEMSVER
ncbi:MAG TPA: chemotaxis protein CheB [Polyangiaceae bacterium]|nr:chemotaxis protein CheB [Polyangiaceae bacterium]